MKKFQLLLFFCLCIPFISATAATKVITLTTPSSSSVAYSDEINLDANQTASIFRVRYNDLGGGSWSQSYVYLEVYTNGSWFSLLWNADDLGEKFVLQGPCKFRIRGRSYYVNGSYKRRELTVFYNEEVTNTNAGTAAKFATVIPENLENNVTISLEQSTDLVNWSSISPGVFSPSTSKRFFRVVSEEQ